MPWWLLQHHNLIQWADTLQLFPSLFWLLVADAYTLSTQQQATYISVSLRMQIKRAQEDKQCTALAADAAASNAAQLQAAQEDLDGRLAALRKEQSSASAKVRFAASKATHTALYFTWLAHHVFSKSS